MLASKPYFSTQYSSVTRLIFIVESIPHKKEQNQAQKYDLFFLHTRTIVVRCNSIVLGFFQNQQSKKSPMPSYYDVIPSYYDETDSKLNFESLSTSNTNMINIDRYNQYQQSLLPSTTTNPTITLTIVNHHFNSLQSLKIITLTTIVDTLSISNHHWHFTKHHSN